MKAYCWSCHKDMDVDVSSKRLCNACYAKWFTTYHPRAKQMKAAAIERAAIWKFIILAAFVGLGSRLMTQDALAPEHLPLTWWGVAGMSVFACAGYLHEKWFKERDSREG